MKRTFNSFVLFLFCACGSSSSAQQQTPQPSRQEVPPISVQKVKGNIYEVKGGSGANTGFLIGEKEVLVIDAKMTEETAKQMVVEIRKLTSNPIRYIALTHSDGDHVNGLVGLPKGIDIVSHERTRVYVSEAFQSPEQRACLPTITFSDKFSLYLAGPGKETRIDLLYFGPAHTDGDVVVYFPEERVAFLGDLLFIGRDPLIHRPKNGSSFGLVKVLKAILNMDAEIFVHGHGDPATKKEIEVLIHNVEEKQDKIRELVRQGRTLEEVKKVLDVQDQPGRTGSRRWMSLPEVIYLELTEKK